jgi:hypothetical protein
MKPCVVVEGVVQLVSYPRENETLWQENGNIIETETNETLYGRGNDSVTFPLPLRRMKPCGRGGEGVV